MIEDKSKFNQNIEALRGYAALCVLIFHLIINSEFNLGFDFRLNFFPYSPPGHLMVMIFFMLSGYVIGLTNKPTSGFDAAIYLKKRMLRIYPIYAFSILLTIILFKDELSSIIGNFLFVQNLVVDNLHKNHSLWSLNHEMLYYLLAIPLLHYKLRSEYVIGGLFILLAFSLFIYPFPAYMEAYIIGFGFWLLGFILSRQPVTGKVSSNEIASVLVLLLSAEFLNLFSVILSKIPTLHGTNNFIQAIVSYNDLSSVPICLYTMLVFTGTNEKIKKGLFYVVYGSIFLHLGYLLYSGSFFQTKIFILPGFFAILALILQTQKKLEVNMSFLTWFGSISYAVYVIHAPILFSFQYIPYFGGTALTFLLRIIVIIPLVIAIAYILEKKMQPFIKKIAG